MKAEPTGPAEIRTAARRVAVATARARAALQREREEAETRRAIKLVKRAFVAARPNQLRSRTSSDRPLGYRISSYRTGPAQHPATR